VLAFLFPRDVFGLAEDGRYVNSTQTITLGSRVRQFFLLDRVLIVKQIQPSSFRIRERCILKWVYAASHHGKGCFLATTRVVRFVRAKAVGETPSMS